MSVTNDAVVGPPDHAVIRAKGTTDLSAFILTTRLRRYYIPVAPKSVSLLCTAQADVDLLSSIRYLRTGWLTGKNSQRQRQI